MDINQTISKLADIGLTPEAISSTVDRPIELVQAVLTTTAPVAVDKELQAQSRALARLTMKRAMLLMQFGAPATQLALMRSILPTLMRTLGADNDGSGEEAKTKLEVLFAEIRQVHTTGAVIDAPSFEATIEPTEDQGQEPRDTAV